MFQNPGPEQDPCGDPFVMSLSVVKFCVYGCFPVAEKCVAEAVQVSWTVEVSRPLKDLWPRR